MGENSTFGIGKYIWRIEVEIRHAIGKSVYNILN